MKIDVKQDPFYKEIHLPLENEISHARIEVHHMGDKVAFSNPLFRPAFLTFLSLDVVEGSQFIRTTNSPKLKQPHV